MTNSNGVFVRKDVARLNPNEVASLREGFRVLRQRSTNNPNSRLGLLGQANIHRDACSHANWWFLPWHRGYIYYFEQILREAAGDPSLALPYWNWTEHRRLPAAFWGPNNPLNDSTRENGRTGRQRRRRPARYPGNCGNERLLHVCWGGVRRATHPSRLREP
jgi:hypothetical protein